MAFPLKELAHRARSGDQAAKQLLRVGNEFVAKRILLDSLPFRLAWKVVAVAETFGLVLHDHYVAKPLGLDLEAQLAAVKAARQSPVTRAAEFASKSGSVFAEADDRILKAKYGAMVKHEFGGFAREVHRTVAEALRERHAYDRGDEKLLRRVERVRDQLGARIERLADPFLYPTILVASNAASGGAPFAEPLGSIESYQVIEGQAGDIAARMAATLYEREGLAGLVKRFDFVTFNGQRVTENNLEEVLRRMAALCN